MRSVLGLGGQCPAGGEFQYRVGLGRVLDKIPGSGSVLGRVGVSEFLFYIRVFPGMSGIFGYFWVTHIS